MFHDQRKFLMLKSPQFVKKVFLKNETRFIIYNYNVLYVAGMLAVRKNRYVVSFFLCFSFFKLLIFFFFRFWQKTLRKRTRTYRKANSQSFNCKKFYIFIILKLYYLLLIKFFSYQ